MTDEIDWVAEARRIGVWRWNPTRQRGEIDGGEWEVVGRGETEQLAARDAVLRVRKLCKVARPEAEAVIEAVRSYLVQSVGRSTDRMLAALAALDAKERNDGEE